MISGPDKIEVKDDRTYGTMLNKSIAVADRMEPTIQESKGQISQHSRQRPVKALLAGNKQNRLRRHQIYRVFQRAVKDIGLNRCRQIIGNINFSSPTPHSLRHAFAVNTLRRIKERGKSPLNALPVLATYMGHSEYKHTIKYLKVLDAEQRQAMFDLARSHQEEI